jgi:leucyl/phenylalanyl-tRNA--protein transferase
MFTRRRDGSKVALAGLVGRLPRPDFTLVDIQILTAHTARLGAVEVSRAEYLRRLRAALALEVSFGEDGRA